MTTRASCRGCPAEIVWAKMPSGKLNPLNVEEVAPAAAGGVIAYNAETGGGMPLSADNAGQWEAWRQAGATFHTSHFATCVARQKFGGRS